MDVEYPVEDLECDLSDEFEEDEDLSDAEEHKDQLERLKTKQPEFFQFLKENDKELLQFSDEDIEENVDTDVEGAEMEDDEKDGRHEMEKKEEKLSKKAITSEMVDSWCKSVQEDGKIGAIRSLMQAFRIACHYGDDSGDDASTKFTILSSSVFNKIMSFVFREMDGIIRKLLGLPESGGKKETINDVTSTRKWKNYNHLVKSYLGNALHVLNQMTDADMISYTFRRIKYSSVLLCGFPNLLRKYIKVALHFWGTGGGALPVVCFFFLRELCVQLGSDCLDECCKGIYKAYVLNCQFINATKLQHIQFLGNCVIEILRVDLPTAYQHAFVFIRQLAMILRDALTMKTKESFRKVYEWKFINCLELWTGAVCSFSSEADFRPLTYPLTQVITGVARLVPTARYLPLRLRCVRMLNRISASTDSFIPVSMLLMEMLDMKELHKPPTGGVGKAVDLRTVLKVSKPTLKTRAFQEACVYSVIEELTEHLAQWSYSVAFFELSFIPAVRLRNFCKTTKIDRFRKEIRRLVRQIDTNCKFTNEKRMQINFLPNDPVTASLLEDEKKLGTSPLSCYVTILRQRAQQRNDSMEESSVLVGEHSSVFGNKVSEIDDEHDSEDENGAAVFSSSWLPGGEPKDKVPKEKTKKKKGKKQEEGLFDEDVVEDLVLSSDEDGSENDSDSSFEDEDGNSVPSKQQSTKQNPPQSSSKKRSHQNKRKKKSSSASHSPSDGKGNKAKPVSSKQQRKKPKASANFSNKRKRTN
ncbi:nucleolar complex-associated protein 2 [Mercurialis annua]|uniref:nucleolar complex-associated protein 2 n=1 Tax=Mercurialis annua TaxID=3986 RepID=UPI0021607120|nr:nucleolar complex-associated protein 2 [Mercurialis annua]